MTRAETIDKLSGGRGPDTPIQFTAEAFVTLLESIGAMIVDDPPKEGDVRLFNHYIDSAGAHRCPQSFYRFDGENWMPK